MAAQATACLALSGVQAGLDALAAGLRRGLQLQIGGQVWQSVPGADTPMGAARLEAGGAVLVGLPPSRGRALEAGLLAFAKVARRVWLDGLRADAGGALLWEVTAEGAPGEWRSPAAAQLFARVPDLAAALQPALQRLITGAGSQAVVPLTEADGAPLVLRLSAQPAGPNGPWLICAQDQTLQDKAEAKVARRDVLLRRLFDLSPVGVVLIDFDSGQITETNTAFLTFGNWTRDALVGQAIRSILSPDQDLVMDRALEDLRRSGRFGPYEQMLRRPDGSDMPAVLRGLLLATGSGQEVVWLMVEDVSEAQAHLAQVQAVKDEAVRARAQLHTAVQALPHGFMLCDAEDRIVLVNAQMEDVYPELSSALVLGRQYEDVVRESVHKGLFPQASGREEAFIAEIMACRSKPTVDHCIELPGGRLLRVVDRATPDGGRVGLRIDVTAEHESERRLTQVIEGSGAGTWEADFTTGMYRINDRWAQMLGFSRDELEPITFLSWRALLHPDDAHRLRDRLVEVWSRQRDQLDMTFRLRHRHGHWVWVQSRGRVSLRAPDGTPQRMSGVHVDVSALKAAEERLEQIIEGAEVGTWHHDIVAGLCQVNDLWISMLGYAPEELGPITDAVWMGLLHPDDRDALNRNMDLRFGRKQWQFQDELRLRHRQGHWVWILSRGRVTEWDAKGVPIRTSGVHLDISARKRLEGDLEVERDFLSTLMETSISGILAVDAQARIVFFNREVQRIFELPGEALLGQVCDPDALRLSTLDGKPLAFSDMPCQQALLAGQVVRDRRLRMCMADGRVKVLAINASMLPDPNMTARVVCTITDVTATARAEDELRAAIDRAEAASRAKSQFLANMSHELRTPLNGVLGMADLLMESVLNPSQRVMLETIRESGAHLLSVVNDILDLSKIESGKLELTLQPLRMTDLASRIETMHGLAARRKGVSLSVTVGAGADDLRQGDATRLLQILHNLVGNAVKFTEVGSVTVCILPLPGPLDRLCIKVTDTGIGMSHDQSAMVFEEFTQGDQSITRRFGGTGLGLPIVRRLVGLMGGVISLVSAEDVGTSVSVTLPLPRVCGLPLPAPGAVARAVPGGVPAFGGLRALLAEDNPTNRMILRAMLARLGISVAVAEDGDEALAKWEPDQFDLILLDISMPRKDGVTALADLRRKAGAAGLPPVLAVTANAMTHHQHDYRALGFAEVLAKPLRLDTLSAAIGRALSSDGAVSLA